MSYVAIAFISQLRNNTRALWDFHSAQDAGVAQG